MLVSPAARNMNVVILAPPPREIAYEHTGAPVPTEPTSCVSPSLSSQKARIFPSACGCSLPPPLPLSLAFSLDTLEVTGMCITYWGF